MPLLSVTKCYAIALADCMLTYIQTYNQEMRADRDACCDANLAEGGSRCFARLADFIKEHDPDTYGLQSEPFLWRLFFGYPTHEERSKILHATATGLHAKADEVYGSSNDKN